MGFIIKIKQDAGTFTLDGKTYDTVTFGTLGGTTSTTTIKAKLYGSKITNDASFIAIGNTGNYTLIDDFMVGGTGDLIFKNQDTTVDFTNYPSMVIAYSPIANDYSVAVKGWGKNKNLTTISKAGNGFILVHKLFKSTVTGLDDELHLRFGTYKNITYYYKVFAKYAVQPNESNSLGFDYGQSYSILNTSSSDSTQTLTFPSKADAESKSFTTSTENKTKYECTGFQEINTFGNLIGDVYDCGEKITVSGSTSSSAARTFVALYKLSGTKCTIKFHYHPKNEDVYVVDQDVYLDLSTGSKSVTLSDYDDFISDFSNHEFKGWSSKSLINIETTSATFSKTKTSVDVYAMWKVTHKATLKLNLSGEGIVREAGVSSEPYFTAEEPKTFTYGEYTNPATVHEVTISIKDDIGLTKNSFIKTGYEFLNYTGVTPVLTDKIGSVSFSFLPSDTSSQSITLTPTWAQLYTLILKYEIGSLVGGDSIDDFPFPRTETLYSSTSTNRIISDSLSSITPTTSKKYNIFRHYSVTESPENGTLTIANNPTAGAEFSYKFATNTKTVTITFTANWQSQYIFTVNFYKNNTSASSTTNPVTKTKEWLKPLTSPPTSHTLSISLEYGETPFGFSKTDYEVTAWSKSTSGSNPITDEEITWEINTSGTTYGKTINLYAVWEEAGYAWIYTSAGWKKAQPWIYCKIGSETTPSWHKARPWIFDGSTWKHT